MDRNRFIFGAGSPLFLGQKNTDRLNHLLPRQRAESGEVVSRIAGVVNHRAGNSLGRHSGTSTCLIQGGEGK
jgi:hypothetical protein